MKNSNKLCWLKETIANFAQSKRITLLCALLMPCAFWLFLTLYEGYGFAVQAEFCLADSFVLSTYPDVFFVGVVLFTVFLNMYLQRNDMNVQYVVRHKSRKQLWCKQVGKTALLSAFMTIYVALCALVIGLIKSSSNSLVNFSQRSSLMYKMGHTIVVGVEFWQVIAMFCWYSFVVILIMSLVVMLSRWFLQKQLVGWFVVILLGFAETLDLDIRIFYNMIDVSYILWRDASLENVLLRFWYPIVLLVILIFVGFMAVGRKEYRNGQA